MKAYLPEKLEMDMGHALLVEAVDLALFASIIGLVIKPQRYMSWVTQLNSNITDTVNNIADNSENIGSCMHWFDNYFSFVTRQKSEATTTLNADLLTRGQLMEANQHYKDSVAGSSSASSSAGDSGSESGQENIEEGNGAYQAPGEIANNPMINPVGSGGPSA